MAQPETWPCLTDEFLRHVHRLRKQLGGAAEPVIAALVEAIRKLDAYSWDGSLPLRPYGVYGDSFAYQFHPQYILTFRRETERDENKQPVRIRLYLKTIQRAPG